MASFSCVSTKGSDDTENSSGALPAAEWNVASSAAVGACSGSSTSSAIVAARARCSKTSQEGAFR